MDKFDLSGKVALVTGAGKGLGKEIAIRLSSLGVKVLLCGRNKERLEEVKEHCKNAEIHIVDVKNEESVKLLFKKVQKVWQAEWIDL